MTDLETLHEAWQAPAAPSDRARTEARAALLNRARPRAQRRRLAVAGAVAVAVVVGLAVLDDPSGNRPQVPIASAAVLERAAAAAERRQFTPPRDDQWIYFEDRIATSDGGEPRTRRTWRRVDGAGIASVDGKGKLRIELMRGSKRRPLRVAVGPLAGYATLAALPTDPDALLRWAYRQAADVAGAGVTEHGDVYAIFNGMLRDNVLPPDFEAAIYRALKQVPNVTVERTEVAGRPALVLGQTEDWLREEMILDAETYRYLGERGTVVRNAVIDPAKAGNATGEIERGHRVIAERIVTAIVDEPGRRP